MLGRQTPPHTHPRVSKETLLRDSSEGEQRHQAGKRTYLVRSIRDDGGQFDSICPSKAFLMGAIYFLFTVRSSSSRLGCGQKHKPVTVPELPGEAVATSNIDHRHHAPSALPPQGPHLPLGHETDARPASSPKSPCTGSSPYPETRRPARSAAQRTAKAWPAAQAAAASPARPGGRASERAGERARGEPGATRPRRGRGEARALPPRTCVAGVSLAQVGSAPPSAPNLLNSRNGRAGGRAGRGTSRAHDAAKGPTWRSPGARRGTERGCGPARSPKESPVARTRKRHSSPRPRAAVAAQGGPPRRSRPASWRARGRAQAVDRRNRRAQQPKELEPERAGPRRP